MTILIDQGEAIWDCDSDDEAIKKFFVIAFYQKSQNLKSITPLEKITEKLERKKFQPIKTSKGIICTI